MNKLLTLLLIFLWSCGFQSTDKENLSFTYCLDPTAGKIRSNDQWYQVFYNYLLTDSARHYMGGLIATEDTLVISLLNQPEILLKGRIIQKDSVKNAAGIRFLKVLEKRGNFFNYRLVFTERHPSVNILLIDLPKKDSLAAMTAYTTSKNIDLIEYCR